jgi:hypothetical protein
MSILKIVGTLSLLMSFSVSAETLNYSGRLTLPSGKPVDGPVNLTVEIYSNAALVCTKTVNSVSLSNGVFNIEADFGSSCTGGKTFTETAETSINASESLFVKISDITNVPTVEYPLQSITNAPVSSVALKSLLSSAVVDQSISDTSMKGVGSNCDSGKVLKADGSGGFACSDDLTGNVGDITGVTAGTGLLNGGTSGDVTLDVDVGTSNGQIAQVGAGNVLATSIVPDLDATKITTGTISNSRLSVSGTSSDGILNQTDWNTFNDKQDVITTGTTSQYLRGDLSLATLNTDAVTEGTNLYFTNSRAKGAVVDDSISAVITDKAPSQKAVQDALDLKQDSGANATFTKITVNDQDAVTVNPFGTNAGETSEVRFKELVASGTNYVAIKAPDAIAADYTLILPVDDGDANEILQTNGSGVLSWSSATSTITGVTAGGELAGIYPNPTIKTSVIDSDNIVDGSIVNGDINASAGITATKIGSGDVDNTELDYLNGVTSSIQTQLDSKQGSITAGTTAQYLRGNLSLATLDTDAVPEGSNLYYTDARAKGAVVVDAINNSATSTSPSENAVFDALALKSDASDVSTNTTNIATNVTNIATNVTDIGLKQDAVTSSTDLSTKDLDAANLEIRQLGALTFQDDDSTNNIKLKSPNTISSDIVLTLPDSDGSNGEVLSTDGSGNLDWVASSAGSVTSVVGGAGLTGGTITSTGTLAVDVGTTNGKIAQVGAGNVLATSIIPDLAATKITSGTVANARLDSSVSLLGQSITGSEITDGTLLDIDFSGVGSVCSSGQYLEAQGDGTLNCVTIPLATAILTDGINDSVTNKAPTENAVFDALALKLNIPGSCTSGQILSYNGSAYVCADDGVADDAVTAAKIDLSATTEAVSITNVTTTQRNALTPSAGTIVFNTTSSNLEIYNGSDWVVSFGSETKINRAKLKLSADQTVAAGDIVSFDTATSASSGITNTSNGFDLKAGRTYRIEASLNHQGSDGASKYVGYSLSVGGSSIGETAFTSAPNGGSTFGFGSGILEFYTPLVDENVKVKITSDNIGAGFITKAYNTYFMVTELNYSTASSGGDTIATKTTAERDAIASPSTGTTIYNSTTGTLEIYNGSSWDSVVKSDSASNTISAAKIDLSSTSDALTITSLTTAQRNALTPTAGMIIYNTTTTSQEVYNGTTWVSGSSRVASTRYSTDSGTAFTTGSSTVIDFEDKSFDNDNLVTTGGSWGYAVPATGIYRITSMLRSNALTPTSIGNDYSIRILIDGVQDSYLALKSSQHTTNDVLSIQGTTIIEAEKDEVISLKFHNSLGATWTNNGSGDYNWVTIEQVEEVVNVIPPSIQTKYKTKALQSSTALDSNDVEFSDLTFSNLTVGETYRMTYSIHSETSDGGSSFIDCSIIEKPSDTALPESRFEFGASSHGATLREVSVKSLIVVASSASYTLKCSKTGQMKFLASSTYLTVEELKNHIETSDWD